MQSRRFSALPLIGVFAILYLIAGKIGLHLQAGFSEHLIKPIKLDNLEAAIERALGTT